MRLPALLALGFVLALVNTASAAPDAVARGERLFFEHSFGPNAASLPVAVFDALGELDPRFRHEALQARYGLLFRAGRKLPVGFVAAPALGLERITFNCSLCHTGELDGKLVAGLPNTKLRLQELEEDLMDALAHQPADAIMARARLGLLESLQLRLWLALSRSRAEGFKPSPHRAGPGRFDLLLSFKKRLGLPAHDFNAQADIPALFGVRMLERYPRDGALGGDQDLVRYLIVRLSGDNSPLVNGKVPGWVTDLNAYLATLDPPPFPGKIDAKLAARGEQVFKNTCSPCHGNYEALTHPNLLVPLSVVGTDPNRLKVWDEASIAYVKNDPLMRKLDLQPGVGLLPPSLRGVWATAPYLHNGSVPTVYEVLSNPASRRERFRREATLDTQKLGLHPGDTGEVFDTRIPGNGNQGHPFGEPLTEEERLAVIEYLKTL